MTEKLCGRIKKIVLYLSGNEITNWPGSLRIRASVTEGRHNMAGVQRFAYFTFEGRRWYGRQVGDFSQLCHCRELKI